MSTDALDVWLNFNDLKRAGIVPNWQTLRSWQKDPRIAFPMGRLFGPHSRRWNKQTEIDPWLATRPTALADFDEDTIDPTRFKAKQSPAG